MSNLAEHIDSVAIETRAESPRVESGYEKLDPVAPAPTDNPTLVDLTPEKRDREFWRSLGTIAPFPARMYVTTKASSGQSVRER